jgi:hypothetical protein
MIRTQIRLTEEQRTALREMSAATGRSIAELVRDGIERVISTRPRPNRQEQVERAIRLAGRFSSGGSDGSTHHDRHLAEAWK